LDLTKDCTAKTTSISSSINDVSKDKFIVVLMDRSKGTNRMLEEEEWCAYDKEQRKEGMMSVMRDIATKSRSANITVVILARAILLLGIWNPNK
jgi:hypothetical protein